MFGRDDAASPARARGRTMPLPETQAQLRQRQASRALRVASGTLSFLTIRDL